MNKEKYIIEIVNIGYYIDINDAGISTVNNKKNATTFPTREKAEALLLFILTSKNYDAKIIPLQKQDKNNNIKKYDKACKQIVKEFCKKHDFNYSDVDYVNGDFDGMIYICYHYFSFADIVTDLRLDANKNLMLEYYSYSLEAYENNKNVPNYTNYIKYFHGFKS